MTTIRRAGGDGATAPATISYAQAAKGLSFNVPATTSNKSVSGTVTPSKDSTTAMPATQAASGANWAEDMESNVARSQNRSDTKEEQVNGVEPSSPAASALKAAVPTISSPETRASTASTATKDDDDSSVQNNASVSTWDNKSQVSNSESTEKPAQKGEKPAQKGEQPLEQPPMKSPERPSLKELQEAPIPTVNIWELRKQMNAKAVPKTSTVKPALSNPVPAVANGLPKGQNTVGKKKGGDSGRNEEADPKEKAASNDSRSKVRNSETQGPTHTDGTNDTETDRSKKTGRAKLPEKDLKHTPAALPLLPDRDQESWPTPYTVVDGDRRKAQERSEKGDKERSQPTSTAKGSSKYVPFPHTPTVVFNTPIPGAGTRRGGRGGGRGGAQGGSRGGSYAASNPEKDLPGSSSALNGEGSRRGRPDASGARETSPGKARRNASAHSVSVRDNKALHTGDKTNKPGLASDAERRPPAPTDSTSGQHGHQNNTFPRQFPGRASKGRRGDFSGPGDRRKDGDLGSHKDNVAPFDRRTSSATQTDAVEDGEKRPSGVSEAQPQSKPTADRRPFNYAGRERGRGGFRGGRGASQGFHNGHNAFTNGNVSAIQSPTAFSNPRSPTAFSAEQGVYGPTPSRAFRSNGVHRSQSVTADSIYNRGAPGFSSGSQTLPPIQTFMGPMYDYPMVQPPMSAVPFGPYMSPYSLHAMVQSQLEYYFSFENLIKDDYLRKHMDSQGFVLLSLIAGFNRMKALTTDLSLLKAVCAQSSMIEYKIGEDQKDRLRLKEGWKSWVLPLPKRDPSAQHDGPKHLHIPPQSHVSGFEQQFPPQFHDPAGHGVAPTVSPHDSVLHGANGAFAMPHDARGISPHHNPSGPVANGVSNGAIAEGQTHVTGPSVPPSSNPDDKEPDSFPNHQINSLKVIVRQQEQGQLDAPSAVIQPLVNGSLDQKQGGEDLRHASPQVNGISHLQGVDGMTEEQQSRPFGPISTGGSDANADRLLYWIKDQDAPVESVPPDSSYEFYTHLRSKALRQRQNAACSQCPHDMAVLYQFWSHFLIRNFNTHMYDEFRYFAFEDAAQRKTEVGLDNLTKYYGAASTSSQIPMRERVARHYIELAESSNLDPDAPLFQQLRLAWKSGTLSPENRMRLHQFMGVRLRFCLDDE